MRPIRLLGNHKESEMLRESYPYPLTNEAVAANTDLEVLD